jgi:hypothetical protein
MSPPRRLPTFIHKGKVWTIDERFREFRFIVYGERPEFVPFDNKEGLELIEAPFSRRIQRLS